MSQFLEFAKRHFAEKLGVSAEEVEKWYDFVNKNFSISITSSKMMHPDAPETFSARLLYFDKDDDYGMMEYLAGFQTSTGQYEFNTPEEALDIALQQVSSIEFTRLWNIPSNALILFDTERQRERIIKEDYLFKNKKS
ncbi:MAG: hypothetical protein J6J35_02770 [Alphaproteobacteria bacterium]|nr:hypothetical protein [Alphaproteobacteria bacterium]MBP3687269.1 hypothetical protein [Alphaproteobacteria bacterium]